MKDIRFVELGSNGKDGNCELCGTYGDLRPYGPKGEFICIGCGMKNLNSTVEKFEKFLFGEEKKGN